MQVRELMTSNPVTCTPNSALAEAAKAMVEHDAGVIPVVENENSRKPIGVITDRDITVRTVAQGRNPLELRVRDAMTSSSITISQDADISECKRLMQEHKIRRIVVVDANGACVGMIAQADLVRGASPEEAGEVVREISNPSDEPARLH